MITLENVPTSHARCLIELASVDIDAPGGRPLFRSLNMRLGRERVAIIGRNGAGKSSLLEVVAGHTDPRRGRTIRNGTVCLVPQSLAILDVPDWTRLFLSGGGRIPVETIEQELALAGISGLPSAAPRRLSPGEHRKAHLVAAKLRRPDVLLLDEPTQDLDDRGAAWLRSWIGSWCGALVVVSHDRALLSCFHDFFLVAESGGRSFHGTCAELERSMEAESQSRQRQYLRNLNALAEREEHNVRVCRRRQRKKNVGRLRELARATPRARLNMKRGYAQVSQGRAAKIRQDRISAVREWAKTSRRALTVELPLEALIPELPPAGGQPLVVLEEVSARSGQRTLFDGLELRVNRERVGVVGPNGAGKTTLLRIMMGDVAPAIGSARACHGMVGGVTQGATNWASDESLLSHLARVSEVDSPEALMRMVIVHRFPLALAQRPLASLSPGERVRAALICLFQRSPPPELLVLDEPTYSLDFLGAAALRRVLSAWPGGLVVASHDRGFLRDIGIERWVELDGEGGHRLL